MSASDYYYYYYYYYIHLFKVHTKTKKIVAAHTGVIYDVNLNLQ